MISLLLGLVLFLVVCTLALLILQVRRSKGGEPQTLALDLSPLHVRLDVLDRSHERAERVLREEFGRHREDAATAALLARQELGGTLQTLRENVESLLTQAREQAGGHAQAHREELAASLQRLNDSLLGQLAQLTESNAEKMETLRGVVDGGMRQMRNDNAEQLERMRATVDEKLQSTLERRLGESFKLVSDRLEQVHQGLGSMQQLASDVGGLQRVLTNVKTRGGWGEVQLGALLEQVLTPDQFARNVKTRDDSDELVEFAIKLPGRTENGSGDEPVWLPIDAKFPVEDFHRLLEAQETANPEAADLAIKGLETRLKNSAKDICQKYINPPRTTDFGILFLPTEGLYAEAVRRVPVVEQIQRDCRVVIAGPTTLAALLNSLQMGFRTLAIQKRSSEVWNVLGQVKTEFGKFGDALSAVKKKLQEAANKMDDVDVRSRAISRKLRGVQELPAGETNPVSSLLGIAEPGEETETAREGNDSDSTRPQVPVELPLIP